MGKKIFYLSLILFLSIFLISPVSSELQEYQKKGNLTYYKITPNNSSPDLPAIYGDKIVWQDNRYGNIDIYMYDLSTDTETQITSDTGLQKKPAIYGDKIIWQDYRNGDSKTHYNPDIYMYDLSTNTEKQITSEPNAQEQAVIYEDIIVWRDYRNANFDIYMYDLSTHTEKQITSYTEIQKYPAIYGDKIIWQDNRNGNYDIYMYDLSTNTETQITFNEAQQFYPAIYGDKIIWQDGRRIDDVDFYMYDLSTNTETLINSIEYTQNNFLIYENKIVYILYNLTQSMNPHCLYMYDLSTNITTQITKDRIFANYFSIYDNKIVYRDYINGSWDIYLACEGPLIIEPENESEEENLNPEENSINISITPTKTISFFNTSFEVIINEDYNITEYRWDFGDNTASSTTSNEVEHSYNSTGIYELKLEIETIENLNFSRTFLITVESSESLINQFLNENQKSLDNLKIQISKFAQYDKIQIKNAINLNEIENELIQFQREYERANTEQEYNLIAENLLKLEVPKSIYLSEKSSSITFYPLEEEINLDILSQISLADYDSGKEQEYKNAILSWIQQNINMKLDCKTYKVNYYSHLDELIRIFNIKISEKQPVTSNPYLVIKKIENLSFKENYGQKELGDYFYIELSKTENNISLSTKEEINFLNLPIFISPGINQLQIIEDYTENKEEGINWFYFWIITITLIVIALIIYIILQEWYKAKYEKYLFKDRNNLYNLLVYIKNNKSHGEKMNKISSNLKKAGWNPEQITYSLRKFEGKRTGMFEIPIGKILDKFKIKKAEKKQMAKNFPKNQIPPANVQNNLNNRSFK